MDYTQIKSIFEERWKDIEKANHINQQAPTPRQSIDLNTELIRWNMYALQMNQSSKPHTTHQTVITGDSHSCKVPFGDLKSICLRDMQFPLIHKHRYLICKVVGNPVAIIGLSTLVKDLNDDAEYLTIYNYSYDLTDSKWLPVGQILVIKEPRLCFDPNDQRVCLRVDSPTDLIFVDSTDIKFLKEIGAEKWFEKTTCNVEEIRKLGNEFFISKNYEQAIRLYDRAIRYKPDMPVLYLNKASAQLRSGYFEGAYESARIGLEKGGDREKALFRMGSAAYGMRDWKLATDHFQTLRKEFPNSKDTELKKAISRLMESKTGKYDFKQMYLKLKSGVFEFDVADYMGSIEIVDIPGKDKGVIAKEDIPKGTLLMVSKAFATGYQNDFDGNLLAIDGIRNEIDNNAKNKLQIIKAIEKLRKNPSMTKKVYSLYAGDLPRDKEIPTGIVDVARIERISIHNRFGSIGDQHIMEKASSLYLEPSFINHSCLANTRKVFFGNTMFVYSVKKLKKGDEITFHYQSPLIEYSKRKQTLEETWKFVCNCRLCQIDANDVNYAERYQVLKQFEEFAKNNKNQPKKVIARGKVVLKQIRGLYAGRDEFKTDLLQMLAVLASFYKTICDFQTVIKLHEEILPLVDEEFETDFGLPSVLLNLAFCYKSVGQETKAIELVKKAFETSQCVDAEHFKLEYPAANDIPDEVFS